jgi:hypothetical protein
VGRVIEGREIFGRLDCIRTCFMVHYQLIYLLVASVTKQPWKVMVTEIHDGDEQ